MTKTLNAPNRTLDWLVKEQFQVSWGQARKWIESGKISVQGLQCRDFRKEFPAETLGQISLNMNAPKSQGLQSPARAHKDSDNQGSDQPQRQSIKVTRDQILHLDTQLVAVNKPPGVSSVPFDESESNTLVEQVQVLLKARKLEVVHRLDKDTSGVMVFARTVQAAKILGNQFRFHTIERRYLALVHGHPKNQTIRSVLIKNRGDGLMGSAPRGFAIAPGEGKEAITQIRVLKNYANSSLVECRLETGRTHQIRIHLSELGHPLVGEKLYIRDFLGKKIDAPRTLLHAAILELEHPQNRSRMRWEVALPEDFEEILSQQSQS